MIWIIILNIFKKLISFCLSTNCLIDNMFDSILILWKSILALRNCSQRNWFWLYDNIFCCFSCLFEINNINVFCVSMLSNDYIFQKLLCKCSAESDLVFCLYRNFNLECCVRTSSIVFLKQVAVVDVHCLAYFMFTHFSVLFYLVFIGIFLPISMQIIPNFCTITICQWDILYLSTTY